MDGAGRRHCGPVLRPDHRIPAQLDHTWNRVSAHVSGVTHRVSDPRAMNQGLILDASQSRTLARRSEKSACGSFAITSHLNAW